MEEIREIDGSLYPYIKAYTHFIKKPEREIIGREKETRLILSSFHRVELSNVLLLGSPGSGKTALLQSTAMKDPSRLYLEVDLARMLTELSNENEMAARLKILFDEAEDFGRTEGKELVLFIDEFHQIVQLSSAGVEALKPLLADSGTRGIRVVVATTYEEFDEFVSSNQALVERLTRINLKQPDKKMTVDILRGMATRYGVIDQFTNDSMFELIYEYTERYIPSSSQPRKSILVLDAMVGWYNFEKCPMDMKLLADVLYDIQGVDVAFKVDATKIKEELDKKVFSQDYATSAVAKRLQLCVADLNNKTKPQSSFLMTGSSGVGKLVSNDVLVPVYDTETKFKKHGDLEVGDYVFNRLGEPVEIIGTFPHKDVKIYNVILNDGRVLPVGEDHLWTVFTQKQRQKIHLNAYKELPKGEVVSTKELLDRGLFRNHGDTKDIKYYIQQNNPVEWHENDLKVNPYVLGCFIADGCLTLDRLSLSSGDVEIVEKVAGLISAKSFKRISQCYTYVFEMDKKIKNKKLFHTKDFFEEFDELYNKKSHEKRIPDIYKTSSIEQRWQLIQGLFDCDGSVSDDDRIRVSYFSTSYNLIKDIQSVLYSLGISSSISKYNRPKNKHMKYVLRVQIENDKKHKFFTLKRKLDIIEKWNKKDNRKRVKKFDFVGIVGIEYKGVEDAQCILVDDEEHLYQAGEFIVTHNTELSKTLAELLFSDRRALIRIDMTEYALPESLERFRKELTRQVWARPNSVILLDEVEKACAPVTRILLQVLDDGRLSDRNGREVSFLNSYIIMTTNAGSEIYKNIASYSSDDTGSGGQLREYDALIRRSITETTGNNRFPPELLGRIDVIVPFQPLSEATVYKIVHNKMEELVAEVGKKHNVLLMYTKRVLDFIVKDNLSEDSDAGGARRAIATLESEITTKVAQFINENPNVYKIGVDIVGTMINEDKNIRKSKAYAVVKGIRR